MTLTWITNYLTHHTRFLSEALWTRLGDGFHFVELMPLRQARTDLGWKREADRPYLLRCYEGPQTAARCRQLALESDVVLLGSAPDSWIVPRLRRGKLTFRYSERWYKSTPHWYGLPRAWMSAWLHHGRFQKYPLYLLCASAYGAADAARTGNYRDRAYRWGYFPEAKNYAQEALLAKKCVPAMQLLWAGRFLEWKHPQDAVWLAAKLQSEGVPFHLQLIGTGPEQERLEHWIDRYRLEKFVSILGPMHPEAVRQHMERANIFLLTSDFQEGWGVVLNEAMNSGCAVVASHAAGAAPFLLRHGDNGYLYPCGDRLALYQVVRFLLEHPAEQRRVAAAAYQTIATVWNPEEAAGRLLRLSQGILSGDPRPFGCEDGPCSRAELLRNDWFAPEDRI